MSTTTSNGAAKGIEHRVGASGRVTVQVADWGVEIVAVDGDVARVRDAAGESLPNGLDIERGNDGLTIRQPSRLGGLDLLSGRGSSTRKLSIEAPAGAAITVHAASGDVQVARIHGPIRARTASGDLLLVDVAGDVQVETMSGDVAIRLDGPTGLGIKTVSGDTLVDGGRVDQLSFTSTSGDLRLKSELGEGPHGIGTVSGDAIVTTRNGIRVAARTVAGDLMTDLPHTSEGRAGRRSLVVGSGSTAINFRSVSGDLRVVGPNGDGPTGVVEPPQPPTPPTPPAIPTPPAPAPAVTASTTGAGDDAPLTGDAATADAAADAHLEILRALERGEIDIDEATRRLASLDEPTDG